MLSAIFKARWTTEINLCWKIGIYNVYSNHASLRLGKLNIFCSWMPASEPEDHRKTRYNQFCNFLQKISMFLDIQGRHIIFDNLLSKENEWKYLKNCETHYRGDWLLFSCYFLTRIEEVIKGMCIFLKHLLKVS